MKSQNLTQASFQLLRRFLAFALYTGLSSCLFDNSSNKSDSVFGTLPFKITAQDERISSPGKWDSSITVIVPRSQDSPFLIAPSLKSGDYFVRRHSDNKVIRYQFEIYEKNSWDALQEYQWCYALLQLRFLHPENLIAYNTLDSIQGIFQNLGDVYSRYIEPDAADSVAQLYTSSTVPGAIGITLKWTATLDTLVVDKVVAQSPADLAGIKRGSRLLSINSISLIGDSAIVHFTIQSSGPTGTNVMLQFTVGQQAFTKTIMKAEVKFPTVFVDTIYGIGWISISGFKTSSLEGKDTWSEFRDALKETRSLTNCVLDLRENPGGSVHIALQMADELLDKGVLILEHSRGSDDAGIPLEIWKEYSARTGGLGLHRKWLLVANGHSASAAELFMIPLLENLQTPFVGEKTYGKGIGQLLTATPKQGLALATTLQYVTPSGFSYHGIGLRPSIPAQGRGVEDTVFAYFNKDRNQVLAKTSEPRSNEAAKKLAALQWNSSVNQNPQMREFLLP